eukprot:CAMPEP_0177357208 /NCGR_PEP_ID=MMETSP0368-20130122/34939_1 /TAXON_ID=447022 ORGANISM="Scrippsiella hangoei-like, Strain SHHI-4" /NCGR_SAMPLE_ID=MMETSP0368 /ASSEMBLY_ACC=CAM_ASM_000363 /LENGTH=56 /DNA_ID=CAMNT_0018819597 /DNA_START=94 /DNA_END=261 /DNA_ORIENTATION=+
MTPVKYKLENHRRSMQATAWNMRYAQLANSAECQSLRRRQQSRRDVWRGSTTLHSM